MLLIKTIEINASFIPLTQDQVAIVDKEDYNDLIEHKWYANYDNKLNGYYPRRNLWVKKNKRTSLSLHQAIMGSPKNKKLEIDHINRNTLDNRKSNLRWASHRQNCQNKKKNTNWPLGVSWAKDNRKTFDGSFNLQILINGKKFSKYYVDPITPGIVYDTICEELEAEI